LSVLATPIQCVGLFLKPDSEPAAEVARGLEKWLRERGIEVALDPGAAQALARPARERAAIAASADLLVVLGGDGTLLAAAREAGTRPTPILGVNLGTLGFLAEIAPSELYETLEHVLAGKASVTRRTRLEVEVSHEGGPSSEPYLALNDAVITRSDLSRMIDLETRVAGSAVTTYHGDGLIVATPTGSTAYSLSAGGPILLPGIQALLMTPICPHTLTQRPVVVPGDVVIEIDVFPRDGQAQLTVDGQEGRILEPGDRVFVRCSEHPTHVVESPSLSRFDVLRHKLHWGEG